MRTHGLKTGLAAESPVLIHMRLLEFPINICARNSLVPVNHTICSTKAAPCAGAPAMFHPWKNPFSRGMSSNPVPLLALILPPLGRRELRKTPSGFSLISELRLLLFFERIKSCMNIFNEAIALIINLEGGLSLDERDSGNWTGGAQGIGELKGTKHGISAASYPHLDIENLTKEQAKEIYYRDYWLKLGGDKLSPQLAVVVMDCAVNSGVGAAKKLLKESSNVMDFIARRYEHYASLEQFNLYGRGWVRRFSSIVKHAATLSDDKPELLIVLDENNEE